MRTSRLPLLLALLIVTGPLPAAAWAPETRVGAADEAIRMMPASLRLALERYRDPLLRGMLEPQLQEDAPEHHPPWVAGTLDAEIEARAQALIRSVEQASSFNEIASAFGALAHFTMDAGFPPGMSADGGARYTHFAEFCESRRSRFPLVFYGHEDEDLERGDFRAFATAVMARSLAEDRELARVYGVAGDRPDPEIFDDRSVPFAVGSLAYSRMVTDVVRVWLTAWREAQGDISRTPYLQPERKE